VIKLGDPRRYSVTDAVDRFELEPPKSLGLTAD